MKKKLPKKLKITYKFVDGVHFFVCKKISGLCSASNNLEKALWDVSWQLMTLTKEWYVSVISWVDLEKQIEDKKQHKFTWIKYLRTKNA